MSSAAGDGPDSGETRTPALPTGEESRGSLVTRSRGILLAVEETGPTEEAQSVGDSQGKRRRLEGISVGKERAAEGGERVLTAEEAALAARPLPPREIPYPKSGDHNEVVAWMHASDALHHNENIGDDDSLPTLRRRKVGDTKPVASALSLDARNMIMDVACSVVNVLATEPDGKVLYSTGIIIEYDDVGKCTKILSSSSIMCTKEGKLRHPNQKTCISGPVINNNGEVIGLIVKHIPQAAIVSTSIVRKCVQMWNHFGCIAHPLHDLELKSVQMLDMVHRDELWVSHNFRSGFIVDQVCPYSIAEKIDLRRGDVIDLIDLDHRSTVVELEEFLLTLCWDLLEKKLDSASTIDIKIRVHDIRAKTRVCTIYPMEVSDATVRSYY
uniref:Uncharacterized protein n=1 Tax=Avena sativa TaxID=4498 RepID=A0ACD5TIQ5_AVESA